MDAALKNDSEGAEATFDEVDEGGARYKEEAVGLLKSDEVGFAIEPSWISMDVFEFNENHTRIRG